jgi:hypothetical protein
MLIFQGLRFIAVFNFIDGEANETNRKVTTDSVKRDVFYVWNCDG